MSRLGRLLWVFALLAMASSAVLALPTFDQIKQSYRSSDTWLLDRHGRPLQAVRSDHTSLRTEWVELKDVSPALRTALLLSEDRRFYQHSGVDWQGVGAAAWANFWNSRTRGASTVTMQLAGLMVERLSVSQGGKAHRDWTTKVSQATTALRLERSWRKDQILEAYLNLVAFRGELVGVGALSSALFQKYPSGLNIEEAALAAALIRAPNAPADRVASRVCAALREQAHANPCPMVKAYVRQILSKTRFQRMAAEEQLAPHLARKLVPISMGSESYKTGQINTTLDASIQRFARDTLRRHLIELRDRHVEDGAVVVLDNSSGEVLAWIGSSGQLSQAGDVDGVAALRQAGSTLKPFLFEMAIAQRWLTASSLLDDSPVGLSTAAGLYIPQNYDRSYKGYVSVRTALASSLNIPSVRALVLVGPERFGRRLRALGLPLAHAGGYYGYSLALGSAEVSLISLTNAYRAFAAGGEFTPWSVMRNTKGEATARPVSRVMDPFASFIVSDILADREARVPTFGLDNALATRYWSAVKTGTSKDMRDNWCIGFSRRYTVGVWVGNANGDPMWDVSGVTGAAPVWRAVMDHLHHNKQGPAWFGPPPMPSGIVQSQVSFQGRLEPDRAEFFLPGTEQTHVVAASRIGMARDWIVSPVDRTVLALDPDIPASAQKLSIQVAAGTDRRWVLQMDGKRIGSARSMTWALWPGKHVLELVDQKGEIRSSIRFEVRGALVKSGVPMKAGQGRGERRAHP